MDSGRNDPEQICSGLEGSRVVVAAYDRDKAVGMARLIWDGGMVALVTDVIVLPLYQAQGIEAEMMSQLLDFLRGKLKPGYGIQVDVRAWGSQEAIYRELGFVVSTRELRGLPMHLCLTEQIELTDMRFAQGNFSLSN